MKKINSIPANIRSQLMLILVVKFSGRCMYIKITKFPHLIAAIKQLPYATLDDTVVTNKIH